MFYRGSEKYKWKKQEKNVRSNGYLSNLENLDRLRNKLYNKRKLFNKINLTINKVTGLFS